MAKKELLRVVSPPLSGPDSFSPTILYQPVLMASAGAYYSKIKVDIIVELLCQMQERIRKGINFLPIRETDEQKKIRAASLFSDEEYAAAMEGREVEGSTFEIRLADLGYAPKRYTEIEKIAKELINSKVVIEENGEIKLINLFQQIVIPTVSKRKAGYIRFSPTPIAMNRVFSLLQGYSQVIKEAIQSLPHNADRLYMAIVSHAGNPVWNVKYKDLRNLLRLDHPKLDEEGNETDVIISEYTNWYDFRKNVLDKTVNSINALADADKIDIRVSIDEDSLKLYRYEDRDNKIISFRIRKTDLGKKIMENAQLNKERYDLKMQLTDPLFGLTAKQADYFVGDLKSEQLKLVQRKVNELLDYLMKPDSTVNNNAGYTYSVLNKFISEMPDIPERTKSLNEIFWADVKLLAKDKLFRGDQYLTNQYLGEIYIAEIKKEILAIAGTREKLGRLLDSQYGNGFLDVIGEVAKKYYYEHTWTGRWKYVTDSEVREHYRNKKSSAK